MRSVRLRRKIGIRILSMLSVLVMAVAVPAGMLPARADSLSESQQKLAELQKRQKELDKKIQNKSVNIRARSTRLISRLQT